MNIGDKVRLLHDSHEGFITALNGQTAEVEIEDGFRIPVLRSELAVVAKAESSFFAEEGKSPADMDISEAKKKVYSKSGLFLAFVKLNDTRSSVWFVNNTDQEILASFGEMRGSDYRGFAAGHLKARSFSKLREVDFERFEEWSVWFIRLLTHRDGYGALQEPFLRKMKFSAKSFFKDLQEIPLMEKEGRIFQIDGDEPQEINADTLREKMMSPKTPVAEPSKVRSIATRPRAEVDLHAEACLTNLSNIPKNEILLHQLKHFEEELDKAVTGAAEQIIFIHGTGNGTLRNELHRRLSGDDRIRYFQDAQRDRFGSYGATLVKLK